MNCVESEGSIIFPLKSRSEKKSSKCIFRNKRVNSRETTKIVVV